MKEISRTADLAEKIFDVLDTFDYYEIQDNGTTPEEIEKQIKEDPAGMMFELVSIINELFDKLDM